ncbi:MAG: RelA/SpoT family protein [Prevotella sp.]|nr:RelA/SpoT family protein [Prevotella sp.]MDY2703454.1 RelA/SpoT family protein [Prevotella sp.]
MTDRLFTIDELRQTATLINDLKDKVNDTLHEGEAETVTSLIKTSIKEGKIRRDIFGLNPVLNSLQTALIATDEIGLQRDSVLAILLYHLMLSDVIDEEDIGKRFGKSVETIVNGLAKIQHLYAKNPIIESDDFRNLLLSFAEDMRVILIMIADRVNMMRQIRDTDNLEAQHEVAEEASYLYAPLAHKLGLYKLKSELEDLSLKYLEHDAYYHIKDCLQQTKRSRDLYIQQFIEPIERKLKDAGLVFHMKGRTKSIHSIWQKMKKQQCGFNGIYDLFAIRIILDSPLDKEKMQCWQAYSIVTDMYTPNPKRLRDWLSVPKSNGYESLHTTVLGPQNKWVEVQIRTERMDEVAEHGLAAHWRYKGIKSSTGGMDEWLANIRAALEAGDNFQAMDQFQLGLYDSEVFVFSPNGDLFRFPKGATVLDFAYHIHSKLGNSCVGGKVNGKSVTFRYPLHSGDTVEVMTSSTQKPKREWLDVVKSPRARAKIRLALKESQIKNANYVKEMLERRFRNRKIEMEEAVMARLIKKLGFKETTDFYKQVYDEKLDANDVIEKYIELRDSEANQSRNAQSAESYEYISQDNIAAKGKPDDDVLIIGKDLKGLDFSLAKCCNPIYGDPVFGFVTINGGIKIHRENCPNAPEMKKRFGYRIVKAKWSGKGTSKYTITLRVIGNDDIGIVNNITNVISKDERISMRNINIDSYDGLFKGNITVTVDDTGKVDALIKKLTNVKGVKQVTRL